MKMTRREWNRLIVRLTAKAEAGDPESQWVLGSWLEDGLTNRRGAIVVRKNQRAALRWFRLSAASGNSNAQNHLGIYLSAGICTERDEEKALYWFKRAIRQGDSCARNNIADVYRKRGSHRRALYWYKQAATHGDGDALVEVGIQYYKGQGVRKNAKHAVTYFRKAIRSRHISQAGRELAMALLGIAYREGQGVKQSNAKAIEWLSLANVDDDLPLARNMLKQIKRES
jgi:TPR repeat protein